MSDQAHDDAAVLADPSSFTVEDVQGALTRSDQESERVAHVKALEREGKGRRGVLEWEPPSSAPTFETEDKLDAFAWRERAGWFTVNGEQVSPHAVAGALADAETDATFSQAQVQKRLERYLKPAPSEGDE